MVTYRKEEMKNREGYYVTEEHRECTKCHSIFVRTSNTVTICNECNSKRVKSESSETRMHRRAKSRAKEFGREFNIDVSDIIIPTHCPILGIPLEIQSKSGGTINSPSLDRIDSSKGYTKDNIQVISRLANQMKANADREQMLNFANWVLKTFGTD